MSPSVTPRAVLDAAVAWLGGDRRDGQVMMADAIGLAFASGIHLLVQAGTGTGKSLGYLAPALAHALTTGERVVVATATLALQDQLAHKDIPLALDAVERAAGLRPRFAVVKGRANYACLLKVRGGVAPDQEQLFDVSDEPSSVPASDPITELGAQVKALHEWVEQQAANGGIADRDEAPPHTARAWAHVSMPANECVGAATCPFGAECFVEESRARARESQLVVTNHALLAIDAMLGGATLPEHSIVVIDEAHELVSRVTGAASAELSPQLIERIARRSARWLAESTLTELTDAVMMLTERLEASELGRITSPESPVVAALRVVQVLAQDALNEVNDPNDKGDVNRQQVAAALTELVDIAERMAALSNADVCWVSQRDAHGRQVVVAPLSVAGLMRDKVFGQVTAVLTSATLSLGGRFEGVAASVGLRRDERLDAITTTHLERAVPEGSWCAVDVGSPFDYQRQSILYVAADLPRPARDGIGKMELNRMVDLITAAGGRALGLFSSQRNAEVAAEHVREALPELTVLCQGEAQLGELTRRFVDEPTSCLFGTLSLWQGVDVPGDTCRLVVIDKIPFPRPDDPLMRARQENVERAGGNGFMAVPASHAALLLAQGAGRLIRRSEDRGVVAVLDPRLVTARYAGFLQASMPDSWRTTKIGVAVSALRRLEAGA